MTTKLVECVNSLLKEISYLPITTLFKLTYFRLAKMFTRKDVQCRLKLHQIKYYPKQ